MISVLSFGKAANVPSAHYYRLYAKGSSACSDRHAPDRRAPPGM